jgi:hypothetical protein
MRRAIYRYLVFSNVIAAVLLLFSFEPLSETAEVANDKAVPILKQMHGDHDQQLGYVEHMLASTHTQASRTRTVVRIIAAWLLVNAGVCWWCFREQHRVGETESTAPPK